MRALVPTGRRRRREKRTGEKTRENMFSPEPLGSTPTHERHGRPGVEPGRSARPACGGAKSHLRESGCERTGSRATWGRGEFSSNVVAQVEQARFVDVADRPCECSAVKHNGFGVGERQRGVGRRRRARGDLVVSASPKARSRWGVGGGLGIGRRAHEQAPGGRGRSSPRGWRRSVPVRSADDGVAREGVELSGSTRCIVRRSSAESFQATTF